MSARRLLSLLAVCVLVVLVSVSYSKKTSTVVAKIGQQNFALEVAATSQAREKGLGNRDLLASNNGMLFVFDQPSIECFWMKDMHFNIDIIWLSESKQITYIEQALTPKSYPKAYCPPTPTKYVIEVASDTVQKLNVKLGTKVYFSVNH